MTKTNTYTVITGASSGIGYEAAKAFAARGKNLILIARRKDTLESLKTQILSEYSSIDVVIKITDLSIPEECYQLYTSLNNYHIETWINNAGLGYYGYIAEQDINVMQNMIHLNVEALTILSSLYVKDYKNIEGTQLINVSSSAGYNIVPNDVAYSASKFYVSAFTEGLARELQEAHAGLKAKVLAPAATKTEFGKLATNTATYDYDKEVANYHTAKEMAYFLLELYDSNSVVGIVDRTTYKFDLLDPLFSYASSISKKSN